jgi:hypothetical protein
VRHYKVAYTYGRFGSDRKAENHGDDVTVRELPPADMARPERRLVPHPHRLDLMPAGLEVEQSDPRKLI